jgi:hypothetical protein
VRLIFPVLPAAMALLATKRHWGLLNNFDLSYWLEIAIGMVASIFPSISSMCSIKRFRRCGVCTQCTTQILIAT